MEIDRSHSSPNHSDRHGRRISLIVVHATVGSYDSALNWLTSPPSRVSTHYLIRKDGHTAQLVPDSRAAWHAGASSFDGLNSVAIRDGSIGIELENLTGMKMTDGKLHPPDPYPEVQLIAARSLIRQKMTENGIALAHVVRHADIAIPKGRKTDPAGLDWPAFLASIAPEPPPSGPPPLTGVYHVRKIPIYEGPSTMFPIALGGTAFLTPGEVVEIDEVKPEWGGLGHLRSGVGFIPLSALERP